MREFLEDDLGAEGLARSIVVVSTSDEPALMRLRAAFVATRIAESFRDRYNAKPDSSEQDDECPFCRIPRGDDADNLIVARGEAVYAVLNLHPYNPGHLMVLPYRHVAE